MARVFLGFSLLINVILVFILFTKFSSFETFVKLYLQRYHKNKVEQFTLLNPMNKNETIVFAGDSIIDYFNLSEFFDHGNLINRGIAGDTSQGLLARMHTVSDEKLAGKKFFFLIGTNQRIYRNLKHLFFLLSENSNRADKA